MSAAPEPRSTLWFINPKAWPDLAPRLGSAAVLVALTAVCLYFGSYAFAALVGAVFAGAYREWETMVTLRPLTPFGMMLIGLVAFSGLVYPLLGPAGTVSIVGIGAIAAMLRGGEGAFWRAGGLLFFGLVIMAALAVRGTAPIGILAGVFLGTVVWLTDTGAFFTGRQIGGDKLAPEISPSKTWSGAWGGLAFGTLCGFLLWILFTPSPWWLGLGLAATMSVLGQLGDLTESALKRRFRIKDSGDIIPGHGGLMDRLDSLTFPVIFMLVVGVLHMGIDNVAAGFLTW